MKWLHSEICQESLHKGQHNNLATAYFNTEPVVILSSYIQQLPNAFHTVVLSLKPVLRFLCDQQHNTLLVSGIFIIKNNSTFMFRPVWVIFRWYCIRSKLLSFIAFHCLIEKTWIQFSVSCIDTLFVKLSLLKVLKRMLYRTYIWDHKMGIKNYVVKAADVIKLVVLRDWSLKLSSWEINCVWCIL
jgi:hypothetical protein